MLQWHGPNCLLSSLTLLYFREMLGLLGFALLYLVCKNCAWEAKLPKLALLERNVIDFLSLLDLRKLRQAHSLAERLAKTILGLQPARWFVWLLIAILRGRLLAWFANLPGSLVREVGCSLLCFASLCSRKLSWVAHSRSSLRSHRRWLIYLVCLICLSALGSLSLAKLASLVQTILGFLICVDGT